MNIQNKLSSVLYYSVLFPLFTSSVFAGCAGAVKTEAPPVSSQTQVAASEATPAPAPRTDLKNTTPPPKPPILCAKGADERVLEVAEKSPKCFLYYTKGKIKKRVAWSKNGNGHCESIRDQMRQTLEKSGYACRWQDSI